MMFHENKTPARQSGIFTIALEKAKSSVAEGGSLAYRVDQCPIRGKIINLATANGWSPYPLYIEYPEHEACHA